MPSDSVAGFLDRAQANRVLFPEQVEQLIRQPDIPHSDLTSLCEYLLERRVLTQFQAEAIRSSRGEELEFAGYPVIDRIGLCPGGTAYKVLHPSLRTPLVLRRIRPEWLEPADSVGDFLQRARSFGTLIHSNAVSVLDAGLYVDEPYIVIDYPADAESLEILAREVGGAMPGFLAAEYCRVVASALRMVHERGGVHGEVRPGNLIVGPLATKVGIDGKERRRPAPNAIVRLLELGLIPLRPPAIEFHPSSAAAPYLPPERLDSGTPEPRSDIYGLGATLYFLLVGRAPYEGIDAHDLLQKIRLLEPPPLQALRPDLPAGLIRLVGQMMDKRPDRRIPTAADVEGELLAFSRGNSRPVPSAPQIAAAHPQPIVVPLEERVAGAEVNHFPHEEPIDLWGAEGQNQSSEMVVSETAPRKRAMSERDKKRSRMLLILGVLLHLTWISVVVLWLAGAFDSTPKADPTPAPNKPDHPAGKKNKKQNQTS